MSTFQNMSSQARYTSNKMCQIFKIQFSQCPHNEQQLRRCQASFNKAQVKIERKMGKRAFFRSLFSIFSSTKDECDCTTVKLRRDGACTACSKKFEEQNQPTWSLNRGDADDKAREAHDKWQGDQNTKLAEQSRRFNFLCSICADEGRNTLPGERNLAINGGLCCARGLEEYVTQGQREERHGRSRRGRPSITNTSAVSPRTSRGEQRQTTCFDPPAQIIAQRNKRPPESRSRKPHESAEIRPALVKDCLSQPGTRLSVLSSPGKFPSPMHKQPDINWDQWAQAVQTNHGRYPPTSSPPRRPLPDRPSRRQAGPSRQDSSHRGEAEKEPLNPHPSTSQLPPIRVSPFRISGFSMNSAQSLHVADAGPSSSPGPQSSILSPEFPSRTFTTRRANMPDQPLRSVASTLEIAVDETMEFWNK